MKRRDINTLAYRERRARDFRAWARKTFNSDIGFRRLLEVHAVLAAVRHVEKLEIIAKY